MKGRPNRAKGWWVRERRYQAPMALAGDEAGEADEGRYFLEVKVELIGDMVGLYSFYM